MGIHLAKNGQRLYARTARHEILDIADGDATLISSADIEKEARSKSGQDKQLLKVLPHPSIYRNEASGDSFLYQGKTLNRFHRGGDGSIQLAPILTGFDFDEHLIINVYYNKESRQVFLGSITKGLFILSPKQFAVWDADYPLSEEAYYGQMPFGEDGILAGNNGMHFSSRAAPTSLPLISKLSDSRSILTDHKQHIWTVMGKRAFESSPDGKQLLRTYHLEKFIFCLYQTTDKRMWIGTGAGVYYLEDGSTTPVLVPETERLRQINCMWSLSPGQLLLGTNRGLYELNTRTGKCLLKSKEVSIKSIQTGKLPGLLWMTSYTQGLALYYQNRLTWFPADVKKWLHPAHCAIEDDYGYCWISTDKGLFQASVKDLLQYAAGKTKNIYYHYYNKDAGFKTNEFNGSCQPCGLQLASGRITFPSLNGMVHFFPEHIQTQLPDKGLFIDNIQLNDTLLFSPNQDSIVTTAGLKRLTLQVTTPFFGNSTNLYIEYRLNNFDAEQKWSLLAENELIKYTGLAPGDYELQIRKNNGFGPDNYSYKYFKITVPPFFYQTTAFYVLCIALLIAGIFLFIRWRMRKLNQQNNLLEQKVEERTGELQQTVSALILSEEKIRNHAGLQEQINSSISHDIISPMNFLTRMAGRLYTNRDELPTDKREIIEQMYSTSLEVFNYSYSLSKYIQTQINSNHGGNIDQIQLHDFMRAQVSKFQVLADEKNNRISMDISPTIFIKADKLLLQIIIHNLLDNANKYTGKGHISIAAEIREHLLHLTISDTGVGMPAPVREWLNNNDPEAPQHHRSGLGLLMILKLSSRMKGHIRVASQANEGTRITFTLPA